MCPYKDTPHTHETIKDDVFIKIISEIVSGIKEEKIIPDIKIGLFFQNEPLLDKDLFKRAKFIKKVIPTCYLMFYTNGLLLKNRLKEIENSNFDEIHLSLYGRNFKEFYNITGIKITQKKYNEIISSINYLKKINRLKVIIDESWNVKNYSSRAGFLSNNKILHKEIGTCALNMFNRLYYLQNGRKVMCCQDWRHEKEYDRTICKMCKFNLTKKE